jgi:hypothetical protein
MAPKLLRTLAGRSSNMKALSRATNISLKNSIVLTATGQTPLGGFRSVFPGFEMGGN